MKILDKHILSKIIKNFLFFLTIATFILLLEDVYKNLEKFLSSNASHFSIFKYYIIYAISLIQMTIPISFLLTMIFNFYSMHKKHEVIVLLSSGISFFRITYIFWLFGILLSATLLLGNLYVIPKLQNYSTLCKENIVKSEDSNTNNLLFLDNNYLYYIEQYNKNFRTASDIIIYKSDADGNNLSRIVAKSGNFNKKNKCWEFFNGKENYFNNRNVLEKINNFSQKLFPELTIPPSIIKLKQLPIENLSFLQLRKLIQYENKQNTTKILSYKIRLLDIIFYSLIPFLLLFLGLPFLFFKPTEQPVRNIVNLIFSIFLLIFFTHIISSVAIHRNVSWIFSSIFTFFVIIFFSIILWIKKIYKYSFH